MASSRAPAVGANELSERILTDLYRLYRDPQAMRESTALSFGRKGLVEMSRIAGMNPALITPRRRVTVMIIGNHSAGKSSFINYYVEERVQHTGIAVETKGFTVLRSGREAMAVKGEGAVLDNEHFRAVADRLGGDGTAFINSLSLIVRTSTAKDFANIDFIDTPGLLDGGVKYAMDVNRVIVELAGVADLVLVFLDPKGQALVSRTMDVVTALNDRGYHEKMRYYLTQADTIARQDDLHKVIVQVSQNLAQRVRYTQGLEIPCIWIPQADESGASRRALPEQSNELPKLLQDIHTTIAHKIQANMNKCQQDCRALISHIDATLDRETKSIETRRRWWTYQLGLNAMLLAIVIVSFSDLLDAVGKHLPLAVRSSDLAAWFILNVRPAVHVVRSFAGTFEFGTVEQRMLAFGVAFLVLATLSQLFACRVRSRKTRSPSEIAALRGYQANAQVILKHVTDMYKLYVREVQTPEFSTTEAASSAARPAPRTPAPTP